VLANHFDNLPEKLRASDHRWQKEAVHSKCRFPFRRFLPCLENTQARAFGTPVAKKYVGSENGPEKRT